MRGSLLLGLGVLILLIGVLYFWKGWDAPSISLKESFQVAPENALDTSTTYTVIDPSHAFEQYVGSIKAQQGFGAAFAGDGPNWNFSIIQPRTATLNAQTAHPISQTDKDFVINTLNEYKNIYAANPLAWIIRHSSYYGSYVGSSTFSKNKELRSGYSGRTPVNPYISITFKGTITPTAIEQAKRSALLSSILYIGDTSYIENFVRVSYSPSESSKLYYSNPLAPSNSSQYSMSFVEDKNYPGGWPSRQPLTFWYGDGATPTCQKEFQHNPAP
jgi:hypothetical protein